MSFTKLLEADIGMALLPALNLKVLLLNFMTVNKKCRDLARWKLIKSGDTTLSHASAAEFQAYLAQGRISTVCVNVAGLPRRVTELIMNGNSLGPLYEPSLQSYGYLFHINEAMHRFWNQLPHSPKIGMSQAMLNYIEKKGPGTQATSIAAYHRDVKYWGTSRVFGEFFVLFNRPDGTIFVSKDYSKVYLVLCLTAADSEEGPGMVTGEMSEELATTIVHGEVQTRLAYGTLLNWDGVIVQDGIMQERKLGNRCAEWIEWILALRAYQHAVDTNTLITSLYKIPPPDAAAVPMPTMPAGGVEQFRAEHEVLVRRICDQPLDESKFFAKWTVRALATSPLSLVMEFTDGAPSLGKDFPGDVLGVRDYLQFLGSVAEGSNGQPKIIGVESAEIFYQLQCLLLYDKIVIHYEVPRPPRRVMPTPSCVVCEKTESLRCCTGCGLVHYCGKEHQKAHWKEHKSFCQQYKK